MERERGRFNIVDLLLLLILISLIGGAILGFGIFDGDGKKVTLSYTVSIGGVDAIYADKIREGEPVLDATTRRSLGRVAAVENNDPHTVFRYDKTTGGKMIEVPDSYDVVVTILADGIFEDKIGYTVEQKRLAVLGRILEGCLRYGTLSS